MSSADHVGRDPGPGEGANRRSFHPARGMAAGPTEKIRRTVTKVERYHSGPAALPFTVNAGSSAFAVFYLPQKERSKHT